MVKRSTNIIEAITVNQSINQPTNRSINQPISIRLMVRISSWRSRNWNNIAIRNLTIGSTFTALPLGYLSLQYGCVVLPLGNCTCLSLQILNLRLVPVLNGFFHLMVNNSDCYLEYNRIQLNIFHIAPLPKLIRSMALRNFMYIVRYKVVVWPSVCN